MSETWDTARPDDLAVSVHPEMAARRLGSHAWRSRAEEFERLVEASHCRLVASMRLPIRKAAAGTLFGSGQIGDIRCQVEAHEAQVVFVDHALTPVQQRNLEKALNAKVVDRTGLILEIFASRARTREGVLQVELASLNYQLGRLVRSWTHLERQRGGFGFMGGPGERQIELDRRMIRGRIRSLEKELEKVTRMRSTQRSGRRRKAIPTVALVGYTNAGKSTLFNRLTQSGVYVADQLFATLDPTLRMLELPGAGRLMLSDTVGFVQELPHELVDAFKATLEEVVEADLILHVRDAADPMFAEQGRVVEQTLEQLGLVGDQAPPVLEVLNKADLAPGLRSHHGRRLEESRIVISAATGQGLEELTGVLSDWLKGSRREAVLRFDLADGRSQAFCHERGTVLEKHVCDDGTLEVRVLLSAGDLGRFENEQGLDRLKSS